MDWICGDRNAQPVTRPSQECQKEKQPVLIAGSLFLFVLVSTCTWIADSRASLNPATFVTKSLFGGQEITEPSWTLGHRRME